METKSKSGPPAFGLTERTKGRVPGHFFVSIGGDGWEQGRNLCEVLQRLKKRMISAAADCQVWFVESDDRDYLDKSIDESNYSWDYNTSRLIANFQLERDS